MLKPNKSNPRLVDTPDTVAIKPIDPKSSKALVIEDLDMSLDEYLKSLGMVDKPLEEKTDGTYEFRKRRKN